jgi:putative transcriptional regulator
VPKKKKSAAKAASPAKKSSRVGRGILAGLKEAVAHARGEIQLSTYTYPARVDVKAIRAKSGLSQSEFANRYGFSVRTLQEWEVGRSQPPSASRAYLLVIDSVPDVVAAVLGKTA